MGLSLPLVEFYTLELAAAWLSLVAMVALVVARAPVVELVDVVAAVVAPVLVAMVLPSRQSGLDPSPMASVLPQVSKVVYRLLGGLYHPVLGLALAQECRLVVGFAPPSAELHLGSPSAESCLAPPAAESGLDFPSVESRPVHSTQLPFCFSSSSWASLAWGLSWVWGVFTCFTFLGFFLGGGPMDPPSPSSGPGAGRFFDRVPRLASLLGSSSGVVASSGEIMHLRMTIFRPPFELDGLTIQIVFINVWEHGCVAV